MHIRKNDKVVVLAGRERGKTGRVLKVFPKRGMAIVEKVNLIKRHQRKSMKAQQGGIVEKEGPLPVPKLMLVCPKCDKPIRGGVKVGPDGSRSRVCRKCGELIG